MSAVCILTPVLIAAWPAFSAAVVAAATSLGYQVAADAANTLRAGTARKETSDRIRLEIPNSEVVMEQLARDQRISVTQEGVTITFSRDARGKASLCVTGTGQAEELLRQMGEQLSQAVVQQYVYQKLLNEMRSRGFVVVEEETGVDRAIHLKVRHWD